MLVIIFKKISQRIKIPKINISAFSELKYLKNPDLASDAISFSHTGKFSYSFDFENTAL